MSRRSFTLFRHGESTYNEQGRVNGDPSVPVPLTELGRQQARALSEEVGERDFDLAVRTRFPRTEETLAVVLAGRAIPVRVYPQLDDVHLGRFEGRPVGEYRAWRHAHTPVDAPPGEGESRVDALYRYLSGFERMLAEDARSVIACLHDVPIRFLLNAREGADPLDGPVKHVVNAVVHELDDVEFDRALAVFRDRLGM